MNIIKLIWKGARGWLITTAVVLVLLLTVTLVATQNEFLYSTISSVFGGEISVVVSGDASKYQYYSLKGAKFEEFVPADEIKNKKDALNAANAFNEQIAAEGNILLKNDIVSANKTALPLAKGDKVSVFGKNSANIVYGGSGSSERFTDDLVDFYEGLENADFKVNPTLRAFYEGGQSGKGRGKSPSIGINPLAGFATGETPQSLYTDEIKSSYSEFSDAAIVVISRIGGEGYDLPRSMKKEFGNNASPITGANADDHYLELDKNEKALISSVCNSQIFSAVLVVINCSTPMELGFIEDSSLGKIDAALWIGNPGETGLNALGKILRGDINPSGRTVDIFARDFKADPTWKNFGNNLAQNGNEYTVGGAGQKYYYVEYEEGIYYGYRYYETRAYDEGEEWYEDAVVYPFGYGLSYTTFDWNIVNSDPLDYSALGKDDTVTVTVEVTNTGDVAGKDIVQLYYSAPYWEREIEKSHVVLGDYAKTELIPAGESRSVTLTLNVSDMASYDYNDANVNGFKGYELDGSSSSNPYLIMIGRNSHDAWAGQNADDFTLTYSSIAQKYEDGEYGKIENRFDDVSNGIDVLIDSTAMVKSYMSRNDWDYTFPTAPTEDDREVTDKFIKSLTWKADDADKPYYSDTTYKQGQPTELKLYDFIEYTDGIVRVDYEDDRWDELLDSLSLSEMAALIGQGNYKTNPILSIDLPRTTDADGPAGFTTFMGDPSVYDTCFYASECVIGATFNKAIAHDMGIMIGIESLLGNVKGDGRPYSGWYAPAVNIHRSQFAGRNWEYYSEDAYLSGIMAANVISAAKSMGVMCFVKHFALNDQETNRDSNGILTWANEQTIREIYLRPFEHAVRTGGTTAVMSSFNRIGTEWAGGDYRLLTEVLRNEWGFRGMVITDYNLSDFMNADQMIRAGGDLNLTQNDQPTVSGASSTQISCIRLATKNVLYSVAQSNAMNGHGDGVVWGIGLPTWVILVIWANVAVALGLAVWGFFAIRGAIKKQKKASIE